jgi:hypothetical protein
VGTKTTCSVAYATRGVKAPRKIFFGRRRATLDQQQLHHLPVREIAVFKDGHVFVQHEGTLPVDTHGQVQIDHAQRR